MVTSLYREDSDVDSIIREPGINDQAYRPGIVYLNGRYWGIHNIREMEDKYFLAAHKEGVDPENIDFLEGYSTTALEQKIIKANQLMKK